MNRAIDGTEQSYDQHLAIRLKRDCKNFGRDRADALSRIKTEVQGSISVDPGDICPAYAIVSVEHASDDNLVILLHGQGVNVAKARGVPEAGAYASAHLELFVWAAIRVEPRETGRRRSERPAYDDLAARLEGHGGDGGINARTRIERKIDQTGLCEAIGDEEQSSGRSRQ